jgi:hypothetical protein
MVDVKTMNMLGAGNLRISVGDKVVGLANNNKSEQFTIAEDDIILKDQLEPWCMPDIRQSWNITGNAMIKELDDVVCDLLNDKQKCNVTIRGVVGKIPRKMKKALRSNYRRMTKWKRKGASLVWLDTTFHNAEMVVRDEQIEILSKQTDE